MRRVRHRFEGDTAACACGDDEAVVAATSRPVGEVSPVGDYQLGMQVGQDRLEAEVTRRLNAAVDVGMLDGPTVAAALRGDIRRPTKPAPGLARRGAAGKSGGATQRPAPPVVRKPLRPPAEVGPIITMPGMAPARLVR